MVIVGALMMFMMTGIGGWAYNTYVDNNFYNIVVQNVLGDNTSDHDEILTEPTPVLNKLPDVADNNSFPVGEVKETQPGSSIISEFSTPPSNIGEFKRETYKVSIINSTGVTGLAKRNSQVLEVLGYKGIQLGTSNEAITGNLVKIKPSLAKYKDQIMKDLVTFKDLKVEETLPETSAVDLVLVLGK